MVDLNCDMGESFGTYRMGADGSLLALVTSANIACGFHGGDPRTMNATVRLAAAAGVTIGAHVSYPDLVGFGRRHMQISADELITDVLFQIGALEAFCRRHGTAVRYVKAHGALYNDLAEDDSLSSALAEAVGAYGGALAVLALGGSPSVEVLRGRGVRVVREGFADRAYTNDGRLVSRRQAGAVLTDPAEVAARGLRIATGKAVEAIDGTPIVVDADSICVHGDTPDAPRLAGALRQALADHHVEVAAFSCP
jgi:5-oxoprolinase (ATP-hydrolysing) subunit A